MQADGNGTDSPEETQNSRPSSRRSSVSLPRSVASLPRSNTLNKEKRCPLSPAPAAAPASTHATPKRHARPGLDFMVTGKQILRKADRASSLPGSSRRPSPASPPVSAPPPRLRHHAESVASREPSLEDDLTLDLSQISNLEDTLSKYSKVPLATSTPKPPSEASHKPATSDVTCDAGGDIQSREASRKPASGGAAAGGGQKTRSASLYQMQPRAERRTRAQQSMDLSSRRSQQSAEMSSRRSRQSVDVGSKPSRDSTFSYSRDSSYKTSSSASPHRYGTDYSPVSPEYSQSSPDVSRDPSPILSSCCSHSWESTQRCAAAGCGECGVAGGGGGCDGGGEWRSFWSRYNSAPPYDQCPTPFRPDDTDAEWPASSPAALRRVSDVVSREGIHLAPADAHRLLRCAHLLGRALSHAIDPRDPRAPRHTPCPRHKNALTLDLQGTTAPSPAVVPAAAAASSAASTQTDISLPHTRSAPRIFDSILRQLSDASLDHPSE